MISLRHASLLHSDLAVDGTATRMFPNLRQSAVTPDGRFGNSSTPTLLPVTHDDMASSNGFRLL